MGAGGAVVVVTAGTVVVGAVVCPGAAVVGAVVAVVAVVGGAVVVVVVGRAPEPVAGPSRHDTPLR
jgi:hypothetical protein